MLQPFYISRRWSQHFLGICYSILLDKTVSSFWKARQISKLVSGELVFNSVREGRYLYYQEQK